MVDINKIGIITLSASDNCGSLLQAFALKKLLESISHSSVEIIHFSSEQSHRCYDILRKEDLLTNKKRLVLRIINYRKLKKQKLGYQLFRKDYLGINCKKEIFSSQLKQIANQYDIIVVGSDQVWNVTMKDYDNAFFVGWSNKKKIAYAPSLGGHAFSESLYYNEIKKWIKDFYALSVREKKAKECIQEIVPDFNIPVLLDPTLAVEESVWKNMIGERMVKKKYVFYYSWNYSDNGLNDIVCADAKKMQCDVYVIDASKWCGNDITRWNFLLAEESGPSAFLNLMYYADRCYVQSFHGVIFAYIYKKDFWLLDIHHNFKELDTRLKELVELLQMEERILTSYNWNNLNTAEKINYSEKPDLKEYKEKSWNYLKDALIGKNITKNNIIK